MKKILSFVAVAALVVSSLAGCNTDADMKKAVTAALDEQRAKGGNATPADSSSPPADSELVAATQALAASAERSAKANEAMAAALEKSATIAGLPLLGGATVSSMREACGVLPTLEKDVKSAIERAYGNEHADADSAEAACKAARIACETAEQQLFEATKVGKAVDREKAINDVQDKIIEATSQAGKARDAVEKIKGRPAGDTAGALGVTSKVSDDPCFDSTIGADGKTFFGRYGKSYCPNGGVTK